MSAMKILLIRHGEVGDAYRGRFIGITDPPLSESGRAGCLALRERVAALSPARFFASPLRRAAETLELVMPSGAEARFDRRLAENDLGEWVNMPVDDISRKASPEALRNGAEAPEKMVFPRGESFAAFAARVDAFGRELLADPSPAVAVVTHGGVLMRLISVWKNLPVSRQHEVLPPRGSLTVFEFENGELHHVE